MTINTIIISINTINNASGVNYRIASLHKIVEFCIGQGFKEHGDFGKKNWDSR